MVVVPEDIMFAQPEPHWCEVSQPYQQRVAATDVTGSAMPPRNVPNNRRVDEVLDRAKVPDAKCIRCLSIGRRVRMLLTHVLTFAYRYSGVPRQNGRGACYLPASAQPKETDT